MPRKLVPIFLLVLVTFVTGCAAATAGSGGRSSRNDAITAEDARAAGSTNVYQLVQALRPSWLRKHGRQSLTKSDEIVVYVNDTRRGGLDELRNIPALDVKKVEYLDAREAQFRWGSGLRQGVILVTTG